MGITSMIVVSILEGKNFPVRHDKLLVVEAKFDGEVMATDPVPHVTFPNFNTELAWEVDKKGLQMHRLQRTPIKLLWYAVDMELMRKESIGYIILDLRLAQEKAQRPRWMPLLNCKYQREKPEVLMQLFLEKNESSQTPVITQDIQKDHLFNGTRTYTVNEMKQMKKNNSCDSVTKAVERVPETSSHPQAPSNFLKPVLLPDSSRYRIGTPELCNENFVFSVTLAFAANLNKLSPPATLRTSKDYYFYYSLFENDVTTGRFASLSNPDFLAERASVKISSSADLLSSYFERNPFLELLLCCGDLALASGQIPLGPLATVNQHNIDEEPLCIEGSVQIHPIEKPSKLGASEDLSPFVGVTVVLQKVKEQTPSDKPKATTNGITSVIKHTTEQFSMNSITKNNSQGKEINGNGVGGHKEMNGVADCNGQDYVRSLPPRQSSVSNSRAETPMTQNGIGSFTQNRGRDSAVSGGRNVGGKNTSARTSAGNSDTEVSPNGNVPHHFCFSLDICNFRASHLEHPVNVFIRYSYPFFGSSTAILTQPDIEMSPGSVVNIPNGFCSFNFATTLGLLRATFYESPLILEMVHRNKQGFKQEKLIGTGRLNLSKVLDASVSPYAVDKKQGTRRMCSCKTYIVGHDGHELGELSAILTLDDFGPATSLCGSSGKLKTPVMPQLRNSLSSFDVPSMRPNGFTQDELIQAAFELEVWKERQREIFRAELKEKEMQHLKALVTEWKQRDADREAMLQRRLQECQKLENKLQQMLQDAEIKEKQLAAQETELSLRLQNFEKYQEQQEKEMKLQMDKMKMEYEDLLRIDRLNLLELEENNSNLQRKVDEQASELREQKNIIDSLRSQQNKHPDVELKTEVNILKMEKSELQQKLEAAVASKQRYKLQWSQAVRQLSTLQQKVHMMERLEMAKKDEELAVLQRRLMAAEEKNGPLQSGQHEDTQSKKKERTTSLSSTGKQASNETEQESPTSQSISDPVTTPASTENFPLKARAGDIKELCLRAQQLMVQKEQLLKTGLYSENDQLIKALNGHIENAKFSSS